MKPNLYYLCTAELRTIERLRKPLAQLRALRKEGPRTDLTKWLACDIRTEIAALRAIRLVRGTCEVAITLSDG